MPEPIFRSPRNLRGLLTDEVKRNWHAPAAVLLSRAATPAGEGGGVLMQWRVYIRPRHIRTIARYPFSWADRG